MWMPRWLGNGAVVVVSRSLGSVRVERSSWLVVLIRFSRFVLCFLCFVSFRFEASKQSKLPQRNERERAKPEQKQKYKTTRQQDKTTTQQREEKNKRKALTGCGKLAAMLAHRREPGAELQLSHIMRPSHHPLVRQVLVLRTAQTVGNSLRCWRIAESRGPSCS